MSALTVLSQFASSEAFARNLGEHGHDMLALEHGGALVTMRVTEAAQDVLPGPLGLWGQLAERHRVEIRMYQRSDTARLDVPRVRCGLRGFRLPSRPDTRS